MAERKAVNKYIPADFDPDVVPHRLPPTAILPSSITLTKSRSLRTVRLMLPFSCCCDTCGEYVYKGRKFNAKKETVWGEDYLGVQIFRFHVRCPLCASEIIFRTDPQNADYLLESGAKRNFEPWRDEKRQSEALKIKRMMEEELDPMKAIEHRTADTRKEIEMDELLAELQAKKRYLEQVNKEQLLEKLEEELEDERRIFESTRVKLATKDNTKKDQKMETEEDKIEVQVKKAFSETKALDEKQIPDLKSSWLSSSISLKQSVEAKRIKLDALRQTMNLPSKKM